MKYIVITGGVISGVGKGIVSSSVGLLLKSKGFNVTCIKIDPYLNVDAGTIRPYDHGEVFVLNDGGECDLDLGSYERFLDISLTKNHNITSGKIFKKVIERERKGDYLGKTVQMIPHITDEIIDEIKRVAMMPISGPTDPDICIIELGGTVGDLESNIFIEALKRLKFSVNDNDFMTIHVSLLVSSGSEQKTKPIQKSVEEIRRLGLEPDILMCRNKDLISDECRSKLSIFCSIPKEYILSVKNCKTVYHVPSHLAIQGACSLIYKKLRISDSMLYENDYFQRLSSFVHKLGMTTDVLHVALVGKYTEVPDSYLSVVKSLEHAACNNGAYVNIRFIDSENELSVLTDIDGIIVPGGFGKRGTDGIMKFIRFARENNIPFLGICYGFQLAIVEFLRNVCEIDTTSEEIDPNDLDNKCIKIIPEESGLLGGTMKLGQHTNISCHQRFVDLYNNTQAKERCRHRYEFDDKYSEYLEKENFKKIAIDEKTKRMTMFSLEDHPFFIGTQFHPEFKTRFFKPHSIFDGFVKACKTRSEML